MLGQRVAAIVIAIVLQCTFGFAATKAIRFGKLIDGKGRVLTNAIVVVENDRIISVGTSEAAIPAGSEVTDLRSLTGIPGMIDAHTHLTYAYMPQNRPRYPAISMFLGQEGARKTLETGVTAVRDLNAVDYMDIAMRELINMGAMVGPRMFVSGYGLHIARATPSAGEATGPSEVMRVARQQIAAGADWVKMFASTGSGQDVTGRQTFSYEEIKAAVDVAHSLGKRIAVHSYGPDAARDAVRAGADSVDHPADMDDATIAEMARKKIFYVPTIDHNRYYVENGDKLGFAPGFAPRLQEFIQRNLETAKRAFKAGVLIAMGSDAAYTMYGQNTRELGSFVKAGMTPEQALTAATTNGAALLGLEKSLGAVAPGYFADIVAVDGDPLADINVVINQVRWVMKGGAVVVDKTKSGGSR